MKLNYKNRKSDGPKLGHIVAKDLRKQTKHCFAKTDPRPEPSPLMLELGGKSLTDEGCLAMIEGLEDTLKMRDGTAANKLEELHLNGNKLTTVSLRALAPVLELARFEIIDLDLSDNAISVKTDAEAHDWETFLKAFCGCRVLRRIDLSRNFLDGPRAFEILERVYCQQSSVDPTQLRDISASSTDHESGAESTSDLVELTNRARNMSITSQADDPIMNYESMSAGTVLKRREGLRAVPYIILNDTGMTDAGALHFSYILQKHYYPQQLMCPLRPGPQATQLDEYRHKNHCWGLVYLPNDGLTDTGRRLLEKAEDSRSEFTGIEVDFDLSDSVGSFVVVGAKQANAGLRRNSNASSLRRRSDVAVEPSKKHAVALDLDNYRNKIQRNMLADLGYDSVDLWRCAIRMLTYAKVVMLGHEQADDSPLPILDRADPIVQMMETQLYASRVVITPRISGEPVLAITGVNSKPVDLDVTSWPPLPSTSGESAPRRTCISAVIKEEDGSKYDSDVPGHISEVLWKDILVQAVGGEGILSTVKQDKIIRYARDRVDPLERSELGKPEPFKLWFILKRMDCLEYEMKE